MSEPPPAIQPHGFLIGLSDDWLVTRASVNVGEFLGGGAGELIGTAATDILSVDAVHALRNRLALLRGPDAVERLYRCRLTGDARDYDVAVHIANEETVIEAEPSTGKTLGDISGTIRGMVRHLDRAASLTDLLDAGILQLRAMTGFDRVMVRRLEPSGAGRIVAECARGGIRSRLGETSAPIDPARQVARRRCALHVTADVDAAPVAVAPAEQADGRPIDLSLAVLRAAAADEVEDLRANGVKAAMTVALTVGEGLWGLIECHHHFARSPGFERRAMADLFAQQFALHIRIKELEAAAAG